MSKKKNPLVIREPQPAIWTADATTYENQMGKMIATAEERGYMLEFPPIFTHLACPVGANYAAVGSRWPHFALIFRLRERAPA